MRLESSVVDHIKHLFERSRLLLVLFLEDEKYEDMAILAFIEYNRAFMDETQKIGLRDARLFFDSGTVIGKPMPSGEFVDLPKDESDAILEASLKKSFYADCIKGLPSNRIDRLDSLIGSHANWTIRHDVLAEKYLDNEWFDFIENRVYLKR